MKSLWNDSEAQAFGDDPLSLRVYTSRLLGRDPDLVMHGGGNTSVKITVPDFFGTPTPTLFVKGSGWDLATLEAEGLAPVRMDVLTRLAGLETLRDSDMVRVQRSAMLDPSAPSPSVEAILHAVLPFRFVDHSHADAVVALTNTPDGERRVREVYGDRVLIVPYVMPGFVLARAVYEQIRGEDGEVRLDPSKIDGMVLMNHGVFTFSDDGRESYERMIRLVDQAEKALAGSGALAAPRRAAGPAQALDAEELARVRRRAGELRGEAVRVRLEDSPAARGFAERDDVSDLATRGPLTPDHSIYTKRVPAVLDSSSELDLEAQLDAFAEGQNAYFERHSGPEHGRLDPSPRWAVWRGRGTLAFGHTEKQLRVIGDLARHTCRAAQWAESLGGWRALGEREIFDVEYWELEQIKLRKGKKGAARPLEGKVAWVSGAASGIGRASAERLMAAGAAVVGLDIDPAISWLGGGGEAGGPGAGLGLVCDVADPEALERSRDRAAAAFGGVDIVVSNAGFFPSGETLENLDDEVWQRSLELNLTAHRRLLKLAIPLLRHGFDPAVIFIASKNVPAPGPAAGAYSAAKAGLTQLARVAALELGEDGIRVNVLHPDGVFDTGLWSEELIAQRAARYGLSPEGYRTQNVLGVEVRSADVARAVCCLAGTEFGVTTGAQIAVDGGNDRVL